MNDKIELAEDDVKTFQSSYFVRFLKNEFIKRKTSNPSYSIRAFSRQIGYDQSFISKVLKGQKKVSVRTIIEISNKLKLSADEINLILKEELGSLAYTNIETNLYDIFDGWLPWAVLEQIKVNHGHASVEGMIKSLGTTVDELKTVLDNLVEKKIIHQDQDNFYSLTSPNNMSLNHFETSESRKKLIRQHLELSLKALDAVEISHRAHLGLTIAISKKSIQAAKKRLIEFQVEFADLFQPANETELDEVYHLGISFFPISKVKDKG